MMSKFSEMKRKVLFVGSFKDKAKDGAVGGQMFACRSLVNSDLAKDIEWILLDTTGNSVPPPPVYIRLFAAIQRVMIFLLLLIFKRPDSVLIFAGNGFSIYEKGLMAIIASALNKKVIIAPRGGPIDMEIKRSRLLKKFVEIVFKRVDFIICQGTYWKLFFSEMYPSIPSNNFFVIANWIDIENYRIDKFNLKKDQGVITILFMGWIYEEKGVFDIFRALKNIPPIETKLRLVFLGDGLARSEIMKMANSGDYHFAEFDFPGWVHGEEKLKYLAQSDIFILPSYSEGLPNSLMEAMACGIPSIASNVGAIADLIIDGRTGIMINPGDSSALAIALKSLIINKDLRKGLSIRGIEKIRENHSLGNAIDKFKQIL